MEHQVDTIVTPDGVSLFCQSWTPPAPEAVVVLAHGYAEHSGRYEHVVDALLKENLAIHALDHRGHGKSDGQKGYVGDFSLLVGDLNRFIQRVQSQYPDKKTILLGHSMGGAMSLRCQIDHPAKIDLLVLSAPYLVDGGNVSPLLVKLSKVIAKLVPQLPVQAIDSSAVSRDPDVIRAYDEDPLNSRRMIRAATGAQLLSVGPAVLAKASQINTPVLVMHGDADSLASVEGSRNLDQCIGSIDKTLKIYPGLYHEIFNEPERDQVIAEVVDWLRARL